MQESPGRETDSRAVMDRPRLVVATPVPPSVVARLAARTETLDIAAQPPATWPGALAGAHGLLVSSAVPVDEALLTDAPDLRIVATASVGYDNIDTAALARRGIALTNTKGALDEAVADLTFWLVTAALRNLGVGLQWVRSGRWTDGAAPFGRDVSGATLGIVGLGAIGEAVVRRAHVSGMRVIYHNRRPRIDDAQTGASYRSFDALLAEADCVVILVPLSARTRGLFDDAAFARMKDGATLVNVARGPVVDTAALLRALEGGRLGGAALDVTDPEPLPADHPLLAKDNVLIVPHVGSATVETRTRMAMLAAENLLASIDGKALLTPVEVSV